MKRIKIYQAIATFYVLSGVLFMMLVENHLVFGIMAVLCFIGAEGYHRIAEERKTILSNQMYEGSGND